MAESHPPGGAKAGKAPGRGHTRQHSNSSNGDYSSVSEDMYTASAHPRSEPITRRPSTTPVWVPAHINTSESTPVSPIDTRTIRTIQSLPGNDRSGLYSAPTTSVSSPRQLFSQSPFLHHTHRQPVKETHLLDVDFDPISGRKSINRYEVINEIGRGVHGKVKLGRDLESGDFVAIKIVERNSRPRLGKQGQKKGGQEEKVKREIAILKKCRHENVVKLIEVIDDPNSKKVYLVLEFVEFGEVKWRRAGDQTIAQKEALRMEKLRALALGTPDAREEEQRQERQLRRYIAKQHAVAKKERKERKRRLEQASTSDHVWSLEFGGETEESVSDEDENAIDFSEDDETPTAMLESSDVNLFTPAAFPRNYSLSTIATNSSDIYDQDLMYIPALTIEQARRVFRDTVLGLEYLHYQGIIHRDIKPANLLWNKEHRVKISDFGVSYLGQGIDEEGNVTLDQTDIELAKTVGTPAFFAPELCYTDISKPRPQISEAIDVWALGVTLYCLVFARCPFLAGGEYELYQVIANQELFIPNTRLRVESDSASGSRPNTRRSQSHKHNLTFNLSDVPEDEPSSTHEPVSPELRDLLQKLLVKDPAQRITLPEVKHHPWVLQDLDDPISWIEESDPRRARRVEISREDVDHAVVPATVLGRVRNSIRKVVGGLAGAVGLRRRAHSAVTIPTASDFQGLDGAADEPEVIHDRDTQAQKALKREKNLAPPTPQSPMHPPRSPLRRAASVNPHLDFKPPVKAGLLPATGSKALPPAPVVDPSATYEYDHGRGSRPNSQFTTRLAIGRLLRASKSRDMHKEFRATDTISEPGDSDPVWKPAEKEKKSDASKDKQNYNSMRGWSGVIRRGSRQSCDSIMRLAAGFSDNKSSRSASPMPSMPSSPSEEPRPIFPPPTPNKKSPVSPVSDMAAFNLNHRPSRDVSPISAQAVEIPRKFGHCPPSPDDMPTSYLDVLATRDTKEGLRSGDDSSVSNSTARVPVYQTSSTAWGGFNNYGRPEEPEEVSPGTSIKSPIVAPETRSPRPRHQHTRSFHVATTSNQGDGQDRQALTSSSSEERFATSSLSNSTSLPSVTSQSTDDYWPQKSFSPKARLGSGERLNSLGGLNAKPPSSGDRYGSRLESVNEPTLYDLTSDGGIADDEGAYDDDDDSDDEDEGLTLNFGRKKDVRSNSMAASSRPQLLTPDKMAAINRRKSVYG